MGNTIARDPELGVLARYVCTMSQIAWPINYMACVSYYFQSNSCTYYLDSTLRMKYRE
jgi:hypothetical protein